MNTDNSYFTNKTLISIISLFFLLVTTPTIIKAFNYGYYFLDLGSYVEQISRISLFNWNPFIPHWGTNMLNDHFHPILILLSPLSKIIPPYILLILIESFSFVLAIVLFYQYFKKNLSNPLLIFSIIYILFNHATIIALDFPIHPESFSIILVILLFITYYKNNFKLFLFFLIIFIFFFKEENSFVGIAIGIYFLIKKEYKKGFIILLISGFLALWILKLRFTVFGVGGYHKDWLDQSLSNITNLRIMYDDFLIFLKNQFLTTTTFYFFFPILYILIRNIKSFFMNKKNIDWMFFIMSLPLIASKIILIRWNDHRLFSISILLFLFVIFNHLKLNLIRLKKLEIIFLILFIFFSSYKIYFSSFKYISGTIISSNIDFFKKIDSKIFTQLENNELKRFFRAKSIDKAVIRLRKEKKGTVLIHENIHPKFFNYQWKDVYCISKETGIPTARLSMIKNKTLKPITFNYFLIAKDGGRWEIHSDKIDQIIKNVRNNKKAQVWIDDEYIFLAKLNYILPIDKHTIE